MLKKKKEEERRGPSPHDHRVKRGTAINAWTPAETDFLTTRASFFPLQTIVSWWKQLGLSKIYGTMSFCVTTDQQYAYSSAANTRCGAELHHRQAGQMLGSFVKRLTRTGGNTPCSCNVSPDDVFRNDVNVIVCAAAVEMPFCCQTCLTSSTGI